MPGLAAFGDASTAVGTASGAVGFASTAVGNFASACGDNGTAIGQLSQACLTNATALGQGSVAAELNSTAIGQGAQANAPGSVALGQASIADQVNTVSVGSSGAERRIVNVAAGINGTDAVNLNQLNTVSSAVANIPVAANNTSAFAAPTASGADSLAVGFGAQASAANSVALGTGSIANVANTVSVGSAGAERRIVNVAAGNLSANSTDAVNGSQLFATNSNVSSLQTQINSGSIGLVQQAGPGQPITVGAQTDGTVVDFTGTAGTRRLTGVSAGALTASSTDAVNGGQLLTANQRVAQAFGGGAGIDANGQLTAPSYNVLGSTFNNVGGALGALSTQVTTNTNDISTLQGQINNGSIGLVQQNQTTRVITVGAQTNGTVISVAGTEG